MKRWMAVFSLLMFAGWGAVSVVQGHDPRARVPMKVPNILGFQTLKCDFRTHTVFSDGKVWPDIRAEDDWRASIQAAVDQGAFIFRNHPGWSGRQPDGIGRWYPEHTELVEKGLLHGIEAVNEREYDPETQLLPIPELSWSERSNT